MWHIHTFDFYIISDRCYKPITCFLLKANCVFKVPAFLMIKYSSHPSGPWHSCRWCTPSSGPPTSLSAPAPTRSAALHPRARGGPDPDGSGCGKLWRLFPSPFLWQSFYPARLKGQSHAAGLRLRTKPTETASRGWSDRASKLRSVLAEAEGGRTCRRPPTGAQERPSDPILAFTIDRSQCDGRL